MSFDRWSRLGLALALAVSLGACGGGWPFDPDPIEDRDAGADADGDTDADGDVDGDSDGGSEDADADDRPGPEGYAEASALCLDGEEDLEAGLADCETLECLAAALCCREVPGSWVQGDFSACASLESCGYLPFGADGPSRGVEVSEQGWLLLSGDGTAEVGAAAEAALDLSGSPAVTFEGALGSEDAPCTETSCRHALGLSLTLQPAASLATGVVPHVGIVLDGELGVVRLYVGGREDGRVPVAAADLAEPRGYRFRVREDGRVGFWVARRGSLEDLPADRVSSARVEAAGAARLAVFGRVEGRGAARVGSLELLRQVCDVPGGFSRVPGLAPFLPAEAGPRAGRPAVIRRPTVSGAPLLMVYETDGDLAAATSADGLAWAVAAPRALPGQPATPYGLVARRGPALAFWGPAGEAPTYHLWLEAEAEGEGAPTAIVHATSDDGLAWREDEEAPLAVEGSGSVPWRTTVGSPTVVVEPDGGLTMWLVGRDPLTGASTLGRASSPDGRRWAVDDAPVVLEGEVQAELEGDGLADPVVLRRGDAYHLWYTALSGSRASVAYAVGPASARGASFERVGPALRAELPWESRRVSAPAVLVTAGLLDEPEGVASVLLWYQAGPLGREAIGLASRPVPARSVWVDFD